MTKDFKILLIKSREKVNKSIFLVEDLAKQLSVYNQNHDYSANELIPYDALCDRFIRAVEVTIRFMRTYDKYMNVESQNSYRDLLNLMEKYGLIDSIDTWFEMRDIRNRIVHEYMSDSISKIYNEILNKYSNELIDTKNKINKINI